MSVPQGLVTIGQPLTTTGTLINICQGWAGLWHVTFLTSSSPTGLQEGCCSLLFWGHGSECPPFCLPENVQV